MTSASPPSNLSAIGQVAHLGWRQALRGKLLWGVGIAILVAVALAFLIQSQGGDTAATNFQAYSIVGLTTVFVPILALLLGTHAMASEREGGTLPFLFTRPIPRYAVVLGKGLAAMALATLASIVCVLLVYAAVGFPVGGQPLGAVFALGLTAMALTAVFVLMSTLLQKSLCAGLAYIALYEGLLGTVVTGRAGTSVTWHGRALLAEWSGDRLPSELSTFFAGNALTSTVILILVTVVALGIAALWAEKREYGMREKAKEE